MKVPLLQVGNIESMVEWAQCKQRDNRRWQGVGRTRNISGWFGTRNGNFIFWLGFTHENANENVLFIAPQKRVPLKVILLRHPDHFYIK
jgi:hypothetical protein